MLTSPMASHAAAAVCDAVRTQAFAACDGELSHDELVALDVHLGDCAACRTHFAADATFLVVVRAAASLDVAPPSLHDRILLSLTTRTTANAPA